MNGVTILNTTVTGRNWPAIIFFAAYGIIFTFFTILIIYDMIKDKYFDPFILLAITIAFTASWWTIAWYNKPNQITYKVIIDDSVSFNDFYERYNVIRQDGKIYTIEEKSQ